MAKKPTRDQFPKGLLGNRRYQLALEAYNRGIQPPAPAKPKPKPVDRRTNLPGGRTGKPKLQVIGRPGERDTYAADKEVADKKKAAEVKPATPPVRSSQQPTTVQKPAAKPAAKPAEKPKPMTQMGDVRGSKFEGGPSANEKMTIGKKVEGMEATPGVKADGTDMERRRAFLDADNSLKGMKAVRELLEKRKKEQKIKRQ